MAIVALGSLPEAGEAGKVCVHQFTERMHSVQVPISVRRRFRKMFRDGCRTLPEGLQSILLKEQNTIRVILSVTTSVYLNKITQ